MSCYMGVQSNYIILIYNKLFLIIIHTMGACVIHIFNKNKNIQRNFCDVNNPTIHTPTNI